MTIAVHEKKVVGTLTGTRKRLWLNGHQVQACELGDGFTHPDYRRGCQARKLHESSNDPLAYVNKSIFGRLGAETTERMLQQGCEFIYGTPNDLARPGWLTKSGYVELDQQRTRSAHLPMRQFKAAHRILGSRLSVAIHRAVHSTGRTIALHRELGGIETSQEPPATNDLDDLWRRSSDFHAPRLTLLRDASCLVHRYGSAPDRKYTWHSVRQNGSLVAVVLTARVRRSSGLTTLAIADWLIDRSTNHSLHAAIATAMRRSAVDADTVSTWVTDPSLRVTLIRLGFMFWRRRSVIAYPTTFTTQLMETRTPFDMTLGSTDNI